jgi:16S rRNA G966 N2-methylase RsmD
MLKKPSRKKPTRKKPSRKKPSRKKPSRKKPTRKKPSRKKPSRKKPSRKKPSRKKPSRKKPSRKQITIIKKKAIGGSVLYECYSVDQFLKKYKQDNLTFPFKRLNYTDTDIKNMFQRLKNINFKNRVISQFYEIHNIKNNIPSHKLIFLQQPRILVNQPSDYEDWNILSDMFNEENRVQCKFFSSKYSPMQYFNKFINQISHDTLNNFKVINPLNLRDQIYNSNKECSAFKPGNLIYIIKLFKCKSMLDPCSGWGDRLIGAMSQGIRYVGVDPNESLPPNYQKMIEFCMPSKNRKKYTMLKNTIQDVKLPDEKFDLVFTSPPYFKIEQYQNKGEVKDSTENEWFDNFLAILLKKTCSYLNYGGHIVLVINQMPGEHYIQKMIDYMYNDIKDMHYLGIIAYTNKNLKNPQPMFCWEKNKKVPVDLYNPAMVITNHSIKNANGKEIKYNVFRDDLLRAGTKQRALVPLLESSTKKKFIYSSPQQGYAQIALSYAAQLTHKTAVLFLAKPNKPWQRHIATNDALSYGNVDLHEIPNGSLKILQQKGEEYHKNNKDSYMMAFGGGSPLYIKELEKSLRAAIPKTIKPTRIWCVAGSTTVLNVLYKIFPKSKFIAVQVGKKVWPDQIDIKRTTLYVSDERYVDEAAIKPPYPANSHYEQKMWKFFLKYGQSGDYIFNVAGDPYREVPQQHRPQQHRSQHQRSQHQRRRSNKSSWRR